MVGLLLLTLAWGVLAFGSVYPWAYRPLLALCALTGILGVAQPFPHLHFNRSIATGLLAVAMAIAVQLLPLPRSVLQALSPPTELVLAQYEVGYAALRWHPLSIRPDATLRALAFFVALGLLLVGAARALDRRRAGALAEGVAILGATIALVAIVQRAVSAGEIYGFWRPEIGLNPFGPFVNRNHFAGWMLMAMPLALGRCCAVVTAGTRHLRPDWRSRLIWLSSRDASRAILTAVAVLLMAVSLVLTMSRSGMAGLGLALLAGIVTARRTSAARPGRAVAVVYLTAIAVIAATWVGVDTIAQRFADGSGGLAGRFAVWQDAITIAKRFWLAGTGLNTFDAAILFFRTDPTTYYNAAHNDYLQLAAEGGLLIGIPVAWLIVSFVREVRTRFRETPTDASSRWIRVGAVIGLVAMAAQETVDFSLQIPGNAALFAVLSGIAIHPAAGSSSVAVPVPLQPRRSVAECVRR